jgi:hypothetical protein
MEIYKNFTRQTDFVVAYLSMARQYEHQTRVEVPKLKHAPINLGKQLEDYLVDPDFEINRRQYIAEQESKKGGRNGATKAAAATSSKSESESRTAAGRAFPEAESSTTKPLAKGPAPDLIDFFESIEQNQQPMATQPGTQQPGYNPFNNNTAPFQPQNLQQFSQNGQIDQNGFAQQQMGFQNTNPFPPQQQSFNTGFPVNQQQQQVPQVQQPQQIQPNFTGAGFGAYSPQPSFQPGTLSPIPSDSAATFQQQPQPQQLGEMQTGAPQTTNPFRASMMAQPTGMTPPGFPQSPPINPLLTRQNTNPFARTPISPVPTQQFSPPPDQFQQQQLQQQQQMPQQQALPQTAMPLQAMPTGTNPFARNLAMNTAQRPQTAGGLMPQPTGSTNPFRQSQFVNTATGVGWQNNQQPMGGGLDNLETVPVFPRPATQQAWQQ